MFKQLGCNSDAMRTLTQAETGSRHRYRADAGTLLGGIKACSPMAIWKASRTTCRAMHLAICTTSTVEGRQQAFIIPWLPPGVFAPAR